MSVSRALRPPKGGEVGATVPFAGIVREGRVPGLAWFCPECGRCAATRRIVERYDYYLEYVRIDCAVCGVPMYRFTVLMEGNNSFEQLGTGDAP